MINICERMPLCFERSRKGAKCEWIVIHYTACLTSARNVARSLERAGSTSTHYIVDAKEVIQCVRDEYCAWHVGGFSTSNYCAACNKNSIGVDLCEKKLSKKTKSAEDNDWYFDDETFERAAELVASLADKHGIDQSHIVRHYDVTHKLCPRPFCGHDVNAETGTTGEFEWNRFLIRVESFRK